MLVARTKHLLNKDTENVSSFYRIFQYWQKYVDHFINWTKHSKLDIQILPPLSVIKESAAAALPCSIHPKSSKVNTQVTPQKRVTQVPPALMLRQRDLHQKQQLSTGGTHYNNPYLSPTNHTFGAVKSPVGAAASNRSKTPQPFSLSPADSVLVVLLDQRIIVYGELKAMEEKADL